MEDSKMYTLYDGEKITDVKGFEGIYAVTDHGRVWSWKRKIWLKPFNTGSGSGYCTVRLSVNGKAVDKKVHRLVGEAFIPNKLNKKQINHLNGNKQDNMAVNLCWVTPRENIQHACDQGLNTIHKLSSTDKLIICQMFDSKKMRQADLARYFGISPPGIYYIIKAYGNQVGHA